MAFDTTNFLEVDATVEADFQFTNRAGIVDSLLQARNTSGEWCLETTGSTTSNNTGPTTNPAGRSAYIYTETSSPAASSVWAMKRKISFNNTAQNVFLDLIYNLNIDTGSEFYIEYATVASPNETTDWTILETIVGTATDLWIADTFDFSGVASTSTLWLRIRFNSLSAYTNDLAFSTWREYGVDSSGISTVTPSEFDFDAPSVVAAGINFGSTQSTGTAYLSDASTLAGSANEVDISSAVTAWNDTGITLNLTNLSAGELASLHTLGPGARYLIVLTAASDEYSSAVTAHRPAGMEMVLSANFAPSITTQRLTGLTGTFGGGRIEEALNPSTTNTDVAADGNREDVWNIQATPGAREVSYSFRVLWGGFPEDSFSTIPLLTVTAGGGGIPVPLATHNLFRGNQ